MRHKIGNVRVGSHLSEGAGLFKDVLDHSSGDSFPPENLARILFCLLVSHAAQLVRLLGDDILQAVGQVNSRVCAPTDGLLKHEVLNLFHPS